MTLTIGAWIVPAFITLIAYGCAIGGTPERSGGYFDFGGIVVVFYLAAATIVSLIAWLVWALL
tara:strand:- start:102 stop:290 length:189 start_codon:yes stop_codon:yes gene_type:complete